MSCWLNSPLARACRSLDPCEAEEALAWAALQDIEVDRISAEVLEEARADLLLERAAPELADALEDLLHRHAAYLEALPGESGLADIGRARAALRKAGRLQ